MCQKFKFNRTNKWYMHNPASVLENDSYKLQKDFDTQTDHLISVRKPDLIIINKNKRMCKIVNFSVPADHRIRLKECEKKDKYLDLSRELKKLWNMKVAIKTIMIGAFDTVTKRLLKWLEDLEVGGRVETIQTTELLRTTRILRRVLKTWGDLLSLKLLWKPLANTDVINTQGVNDNNHNDNNNYKKKNYQGFGNTCSSPHSGQMITACNN